MTSYTLNPSAGGPAVGLRVNSDFVRSLRDAKGTPKLVVRGGDISIRFPDAQEYPCTVHPENSPMEIYDHNTFVGSVTAKWSVLTDKRLIKEHKRRVASPVVPAPAVPPRPVLAQAAVRDTNTKPAAPPETRLKNSARFSFDGGNSQSPSEAVAVLVAFLALGPASRSELQALHPPPAALETLISVFAQTYDPGNAFTGGDVFAYPGQSEQRKEKKTEKTKQNASTDKPAAASGKAHESGAPPERAPHTETVAPKDASDDTPLVLKDRAYKDLRPWLWYDDDERAYVLRNTHNALTRLGFLETHPLRRKICDRPAAGSPGGAASRAAAKPVGAPSEAASERAAENPAAGSGNVARMPARRASASPQKRRSDTSSSDEDERRKHKRSDSECTSPSSIDGSDEERPEKRAHYYAALAAKFRTKYTEYQRLYRRLLSQVSRSSSDRRDLARLFEMHSTLAEWKRKLWEFDGESKEEGRGREGVGAVLG